MEVGWFALTVSILALGLAAWTTRRAVKKDTVYWVQRDKVSRSGERAAIWSPTIRNYGHGVAADVRVFQVHPYLDEPEELSVTPTIGLGEFVGANINVNDMSNQTLEDLRITVKWRQAPAFEKERSQTFPFPMVRKHEGSGDATGLGVP